MLLRSNRMKNWMTSLINLISRSINVKSFVAIILCVCTISSVAQMRDTTHRHTPQKAGLFSAVLPGAGQIYNKKYWKAPIVWAGLGISTYFIIDNTTNYNLYRDEYLARLDGDTINLDLANYSESGLRNATDTYQRWRDLSYISFAAIYVLNIVDAVVDAHLFTFDVSDDLSLQITPFTIPAVHNISGITFTLKL